jgi:hypothetical protein
MTEVIKLIVASIIGGILFFVFLEYGRVAAVLGLIVGFMGFFILIEVIERIFFV